MRFSVAMPEDLLMRFDALVAKRGLAKNRSRDASGVTVELV